MFLQTLSTNPQYYFGVLLVVIVSICLHELAHGAVAVWLGDRTPIETGHMTLNPLDHMGVPSLLMLAFFGLSWGAMPVDPTRLRGRYAESLVAFAGPAMNLLLSALAIVAFGVSMRMGWLRHESNVAENVGLLLTLFGVLNFALAILNLIPAPPLDGSRIAANLVPAYRRLLSDPTMQGASFALTIAVLYGAGRFIMPFASATVLGLIARIAHA